MAEDGDKSKKIENPLLSFVKGGTPTQKSERLYEERFRDGEKRRCADARDKQLASVPIEAGGAQLFSHRLTRNPDIQQAYVLLRYLNRSGSSVPPGECLADVLIMDWENPSDLTLGLMCRRCWLGGVKHAQDCQIMVRMSNRWWHLETGTGERTFLFDDGSGPKRYPSAGIVTESEVFTCPDCSWRARIVNNCIREE